jgi:hypothetical protein
MKTMEQRSKPWKKSMNTMEKMMNTFEIQEHHPKKQ